VAILKRVSNRQGDGAGRALYALKYAIAVRTDIPSLLSLVLDGELPSELRKELAREFNRHLLLHQGSSKTQHYVVSFGHHLTQKEIEKVLDRLERLFDDPYRYHLFVVHQEEHGTAVHIIESADPEGRLRHLSRKEFFDLKRAVVRELQPFLNEREREVAKNFSRNIATEDWKHPIELFAPERSFKEYIRLTVKKASQLIEEGNIDGAIELLELRGVEIKEYKAGELSPSGKLLKRDRLYAVFNHPYRGSIAVRLDKKMRATFQLYLNALEELKRELRRTEKELEEVKRTFGGSEPLRDRAPSERAGIQAEGGRAPKEGAGAPSGDKHLRGREGTLKQGDRESEREGGRAKEEIARIERVEGREEGIREELQGAGGTFTGTPTKVEGERRGGKEETKDIWRDSSLSIADVLVGNWDELQPSFRQQETQSTDSIQQEETFSAQSTAKGEQGKTLTAPEESRKSPAGAQFIQAENSQPSEPSQENISAQAEDSQPSESAQPLSTKGNIARSSKGLGDTERRGRETLLPAHSERLADFPLQKGLGISGQSLRNVHSSEEVEMPIPQEVIDEIKQIEPEKILGYLGIPFKKVGNRIMAQAVWRGEKEASVSIQYKDGKWLWYDFGTGEGGDWIDLYRLVTASDFKEAVSTLVELANVPYSPNISTREPNFGRKKKTSSLWPAKTTEFKELERIPLRELQEPPKDLAEYLELKGFLPYWKQMREIPELYYLRYRRGKREYSGLATRTTAGTWIIKNKHGTYVSQQPSGISLWRRDPTKVIVVEGFTDAMALAINRNFKDYSILILNGLGSLEKAIEMLKVLSPSKLYIALDLDEKGLEGRRKLVDEFPEARHIYFYGKDPAEYLLDDYAREYFPPFADDWITSPFDLYCQLLPMYFEGGYLNKEILREFSFEAYDNYLEFECLEEDAKECEEIIREFEEYYSPEPEEDEPEEDRDRGISLGL